MKLNFSYALRLLLISILLLIAVPVANSAPKDLSASEEPGPQSLTIDNAIPEAGELTSNLIRLERQIANLVNISRIESDVSAIRDELAKPTIEIQDLKKSSDSNDYIKFTAVRRILEKAKRQFEEVTQPLLQAITELNQLISEWRDEQRRWEDWHDQLPDDNIRQKFQSTYGKAQETISLAQQNLSAKLDQLLEQQRQANQLSIQINQLDIELNILLDQHQHVVLHEISPPMLSRQYLAQFNAEMWNAFKRGLDEAVWLNQHMLTKDGWIFLLQLGLSLGIGLLIKNKHAILLVSERWRFIALRPVSAAIFLSQVVLLPVYEYAAQFSWGIPIMLLSGISFIRLTNIIIVETWKKDFIFAILIALLLWRMLHFFVTPLPLFRLGIALMAIIGSGLCSHWFWQSKRDRESSAIQWILCLLGIYFALVFFQEIWGKEGLSEYLFIGMIRAIVTGLVFMLFAYVLRGVLDWIFWGSPLRRINLLQNESSGA